MSQTPASFQPRVSIVIPVYNGADYVAEAIESCLAQTYANIEVVVVNDGSTDNGATEEVVKRYGDRVRYFSKPNGGVATALTFAIEKAEGEYISWLSHDDLYVPEKVERQVNYLGWLKEEERARTILYSNYAVFSTNPEDARAVSLPHTDPRDFRYWITATNTLHGCTLLIPKAAFQQAGGFDAALRTTQDYDLWFRMAKDYDFRHLGEVLVKARQHASQGSVTMSAIARAECNALLQKFVRGLTPEEVMHGSGSPLAVGYAKLGHSMFHRGFLAPGWATLPYVMKYLKQDGLSAAAEAVVVLGRGMVARLIAPVRPYIPRVLRQAIRLQLRILRKLRQLLVASRTAAEPPDPETLLGQGLQEKFSNVYDKNIFRGAKSRSGEGSDLVQTAVIRTEIPKLVQELGVRSFVDAPCGDWYWMQHVNLPVEQYTGLDIVAAMIAKHQTQFSSDTHQFRAANLAEDPLPQADLIFSRDCLVHLSFSDALKIIANFKRSGAKYLLTTTFADRSTNEDLATGFWRVLNLEKAPFNFPKPLRLINEHCTEGNHQFVDKCLGLWRLEDIPMPQVA